MLKSKYNTLKTVLIVFGWMCLANGVSYSMDEVDECLASSDSNCLSSSEIQGNFDLSTPENPLFSLMNASPEVVIRPKVGDNLAVSYLPLIADTFGENNYSIGIEVNPGQLTQPEYFTASELMGDDKDSTWPGGKDRVRGLQRSKILSRFLLSAAASQSLSDSGSLDRYGFGLTYTIDSGSNWETIGTYGKCISNNGAIEIGRTVAEMQDRELVENEEAYKEAVKNSDAYKEIVSKQISKITKECTAGVSPWNRDVFGVGLAGYLGDSTDGEGNSENETGFGLWVTLIRRIGDDGQLSLGARITDGYLQQQGETIDVVDDGIRLGARYAHQLLKGQTSGRSFRGFIEVGGVSESIGETDDEYLQASLGFEIQFSRDLYFQAAIGDTFESDLERERTLTGNFKWSFTSSPAE